jgi:hypothetical protein
MTVQSQLVNNVLDTSSPAEAVEVARLILNEVVANDPVDEWREEVAALLADIPLGTTSDPQSPLNSHLAVDVAEIMGDAFAQQLYRFAVLVTKIAGAK